MKTIQKSSNNVTQINGPERLGILVLLSSETVLSEEQKQIPNKLEQPKPGDLEMISSSLSEKVLKPEASDTNKLKSNQTTGKQEKSLPSRGLPSDLKKNATSPDSNKAKQTNGGSGRIVKRNLSDSHPKQLDTKEVKSDVAKEASVISSKVKESASSTVATKATGDSKEIAAKSGEPNDLTQSAGHKKKYVIVKKKKKPKKKKKKVHVIVKKKKKPKKKKKMKIIKVHKKKKPKKKMKVIHVHKKKKKHHHHHHHG